MMDMSKIPEDIVDALKKRGYSDDAIAQMTPKEAFSEYCNWNGLSGWGPTLWGVVAVLGDARL